MKKQTHHIRNDGDRGRVVGLILGLDTSKETVVTIGPHVKKRSLSLNDWYWMLNTAVGESTGHTKDEIHEIVMRKFLAPKRTELNGESIEYYSTKSLKTIEFKEFLDQYYAWAATDLGLYLPHPDDQGRDDMRVA